MQPCQHCSMLSNTAKITDKKVGVDVIVVPSLLLVVLLQPGLSVGVGTLAVPTGPPVAHDS